MDIDADGLADFQDTFYGDNNGDADGDRLQNGYDLQPYAAPPAGTTVSHRPAAPTSSSRMTCCLLR